MNEFNQVANIKVFGIGGGGSNAVNRMVADGVKGVTFYIANTDVQVMRSSDCENKIILGRETTKGLGAGGNPEIGRKAAEEMMDKLKLAAIVTHVADSRTSILHPASHTHRQMNDEQLKEAGVAPDLIRLSVGIENVNDIIADLEQAL